MNDIEYTYFFFGSLGAQDKTSRQKTLKLIGSPTFYTAGC